jgi:hypothetical protein
MTERPNVPVLKTGVGLPTVGSNPTPSANCAVIDLFDTRVRRASVQSGRWFGAPISVCQSSARPKESRLARQLWAIDAAIPSTVACMLTMTSANRSFTMSCA